MPTVPVPELLPTLQIATRSTLSQFAALIDETRAFGTHVLQWHMQTVEGGDEVGPISLSIRNILELMGAISSCVRNSNIDPCKILLRAMLESYFGLAYMLQADTRRRGFAFLAVEANQRLKQLKSFDPSILTRTPVTTLSEVKETRDSFPDVPSSDVIATAIRDTEEFLKTTGVQEALAEIGRMRKGKAKRNPNWYSLYDGPSNLEELSSRIGEESLYSFFYRYWSRSTHGIDIVQGKLGRTESGRAGILQLDIPANAQNISQMTINIALPAYRLIVIIFSPDKLEDFARWYLTEIQGLFMEFTKKQFIVVKPPFQDPLPPSV
jgi:hypothetical protein